LCGGGTNRVDLTKSGKRRKYPLKSAGRKTKAPHSQKEKEDHRGGAWAEKNGTL